MEAQEIKTIHVISRRPFQMDGVMNFIPISPSNMPRRVTEDSTLSCDSNNSPQNERDSSASAFVPFMNRDGIEGGMQRPYEMITHNQVQVWTHLTQLFSFCPVYWGTKTRNFSYGEQLMTLRKTEIVNDDEHFIRARRRTSTFSDYSHSHTDSGLVKDCISLIPMNTENNHRANEEVSITI